MANQEAWESAYLRFESPDEEVAKFSKRLVSAGVRSWNRDLEILEAFCGRGSGLRAWDAMGFHRITGLDLSPALLDQYRGPGNLLCGDAREMLLPDSSKDAIAVQGGLHHLESLKDLERVLSEFHRVLRPNGRLVVIEPWLTGFLKLVHIVCQMPLARALSGRLDALATMIELEQPVYGRWLACPNEIREALSASFVPEKLQFRFGKILFVGRRREINRGGSIDRVLSASVHGIPGPRLE